MPNADQCRSKSWHWSEMSLNRNWSTLGSMPEYWSALGIDRGSPVKPEWANKSISMTATAWFGRSNYRALKGEGSGILLSQFQMGCTPVIPISRDMESCTLPKELPGHLEKAVLCTGLIWLSVESHYPNFRPDFCNPNFKQGVIPYSQIFPCRG